jgi:hypothetical protein
VSSLQPWMCVRFPLRNLEWLRSEATHVLVGETCRDNRACSKWANTRHLYIAFTATEHPSRPVFLSRHSIRVVAGRCLHHSTDGR